MASNLATILEI